MYKSKIIVSLLITGGLVSPLAHATDGYFSHGYGMKAKGMGGVGIALPQDSLAAATNPAGMVMVGDRIDFGVDYFRPVRSAQIAGNAGGTAVNQSLDGNGQSSFLIPEFGYNKMINPTTSLGVSVYGNGGMNTSYSTPVTLFSGNAGAAATKAGVDLSQLIIAPTWAMKFNPANAVGVSLNLAYQTFAASGLQNFAFPGGPPFQFSNAPGSVTDNGHDHSTGWGLRFGWTGQITPNVTLGATYQTKTRMGKLSKYQGLFAEQGGFDIPANFGFGVAVKTTPDITVAADLERIQYSGIASVGNPLLPNLTTCLLGSSCGAGFGWDDQTVFKLGVSYKYQPDLVLRAGFNHATQQIPSSQTLFNILAPGVVQDHVTLGATWTLANKSELTFAYMHAFKKTVDGAGSIPAAFGGGEANLTMYQDSIGIAYGW
jgi:long-chain fatty acid transport protein